MTDAVNHPSHYETNGIECFDAMVASQGVEAAKNFCACNAFKYIWRYSHKNGIEDLKKANWYINKRIELGQEKPQSQKSVSLKDVPSYTWNESKRSDIFICWKCKTGLDFALIDSAELYQPKYCPECGARVMEAKGKGNF